MGLLYSTKVEKKRGEKDGPDAEQDETHLN